MSTYRIAWRFAAPLLIVSAMYLAFPSEPTADDSIRLFKATKAEVPDLIVRDIQASTSIDAGQQTASHAGAGQLVIYFKDARGPDHFRAYFDQQLDARSRADYPDSPSDVFPFNYDVFVDGRRISSASGRSYMPRAGQQIAITEGYWLPGDGRAHKVRVSATPVYLEHDSTNNSLSRKLRTPAYTETRFTIFADATGVPFDVPGERTDFIWIDPGERQPLVAGPGVDIAGYFYTVPTSRGRFWEESCVASRGINITVSGTAGYRKLNGLELNVRVPGKPPVGPEVLSLQVEPNEPFEKHLTVGLQPLVSKNSQQAIVRVILHEETARSFIKTFPFELAGYQFAPDAGIMHLAVDQVYNHSTRGWSTDRRGVSDITLRRTEESITLKGQIQLNPDNCILRNVRVEQVRLIRVPPDSPDRFSGTIGVGNMDVVRHAGFTAYLEGDFNIRYSEPEPVGRYELRVLTRFRNMFPQSGYGIAPHFSAVPPMTVTVTD